MKEQLQTVAIAVRALHELKAMNVWPTYREIEGDAIALLQKALTDIVELHREASCPNCAAAGSLSAQDGHLKCTDCGWAP